MGIGGPPRHRSVDAVFGHSWRLLSAGQKEALMRLSVFRGGWQAAEAAAVAAADLHLLRRLVDMSLVRVGPGGRYEMHELARRYAAGRLREAGDEHEARQKHFEAILALAATLDARQVGPQSMEAVAGFDREQDNFRAALSWGLRNAPVEATLRMVNHLGYYWVRRGAWHEGQRWTMRAVERAGDADSTPLSVARGTAAVFAYIQGQFGEAQSLALRAMDMARRLQDTEALIAAYGPYTFACTSAEQALESLHAGIALIEETGRTQHRLASYYVVAASWLHSSGRNDEARDYYQKSIALLKQMGAVDRLVEPMVRLGQLELREGRLQQAYEVTVESIAAMRAAGAYEAFGGWEKALLGAILLHMGKLDAAEQNLHEALQLLDDRQHVMVKQEALALLAEVMLARGEVQKAAEYLEACLAICRVLYGQLQATRKIEGMPEALPVDVIALCRRAAQVAAAQGEQARAVTLHGAAEALRRQSGQPMPRPIEEGFAAAIATLQEQLPEDAFGRAWQAGQQMSLAQAMDFVLAPGGGAA